MDRRIMLFVLFFTVISLATCQDVPDKRCRSGYSLANSYCGRGGRQCPTGYSCNIHPADRYAICCRRGYRG